MTEAVNNLLMTPYGRTPEGLACAPNNTQKRVLEWVDRVRAGKHPSKGVPVLYLQGGVGSGKTRAVVAPITELLLEIPGIKVLWGRQDFNDLRLSAMDTFFEVFPDKQVASRNVQEHRYGINQPGNTTSQIFFRELKDLTGLGSQEFGVIVVTEAYEISHNAYMTLKMRCRQQNMPTMILMEGNPPNRGHWLDNLTRVGTAEYDPDVERWLISTYENWDNLPEPYKVSLERLPLSWKKKYLNGETGFTPDGTPFYAGFQEELHKRALTYIANRKIYRGIDFGYHHPACVWCQFDAQDRFMVLGELMGNDVTIEEFAANQIIPFENSHFKDVEYETYYDPAGEAVTDKSEETSVKILASKGIAGRCKQSTYRERKELIEGKLSTLISGIPSLIVSEGCRTIIDGFLGGYHYPEAEPDKPVKEEPVKDGYYEHLMNALEYVMVNVFTVVKSTRQSSYKPMHERYRLPDRELVYA